MPGSVILGQVEETRSDVPPEAQRAICHLAPVEDLARRSITINALQWFDPLVQILLN